MAHPLSARRHLLSLYLPRVSGFRACTHGNSCQDEGRIVGENTRVVAGKISFRFPSCRVLRRTRAETRFYVLDWSIGLRYSTISENLELIRWYRTVRQEILSRISFGHTLETLKSPRNFNSIDKIRLNIEAMIMTDYVAPTNVKVEHFVCSVVPWVMLLLFQILIK